MMYMPTVYEGAEAIRKLQRTPYYEGVRVKFIMKELVADKRNPSKQDRDKFWSWKAFFDVQFLHMHVAAEWPNFYHEDIFHEGDEYIATVCPLFHSQLLQIRVNALNFNCTKREMITPWLFSQTNYGQYCSKKIHFNEEGCPIYNDLKEDVYMKPANYENT